MMTHLMYPLCFLYWLLLCSLCKSAQLSCSGSGHCVNFERTKSRPGKRLLGYNFKNETTGPKGNCLVHCTINYECVSVNQKTLEDGVELCELNFEDERTANAFLQDETGYEYFQLSITDINCKVGNS